MKTKKRFFLKAAGISLAKGAGISLALVMMFAMAFAACDTGTSSGGRTPTVPGGDGDYEAPPVSRIFKSDANGTVELTITEILSASTQTADTQTVDSRTAFSIAAPTSGERFYYAIRVKGYSTPVSQGTVTAGEPVWTFTPYAGESFNMTATGSGASLAFAETKITAYDGSVVTIPQLTVTGSSKDSGPSVIPSGPSAAQQAATALVADGVLKGKATVTGDGTVVTLTVGVALGEGDRLSIPADVTLEVAGKELTVGRGATLTVAADGIIDLGATGTIAGTGTITNNGTIKKTTNDEATLLALVRLGGNGKVALTGEVETANPTEIATILNKLSAGTVKVTGAAEVETASDITVDTDVTLEVAITGGNTLKVGAGNTLTLNGTLSGTGPLSTAHNADGNPANNGTIITPTTDGAVLKNILGKATGNITATGEVEISTEVEVQAETYLTLNKVTIAQSGKLDLSALFEAVTINGGNGTLEGGTAQGKASLTDSINISSGGELYLSVSAEALGQTASVPDALDLGDDGFVNVSNGGTIKVRAIGSDSIEYIGTDSAAYYHWDDANTGFIEIKADELTLSGKIIANHPPATDGQHTTIIKTGSEITLRYRWTLNGTLTVEDTATLIIEKSDAEARLLRIADTGEVIVDGTIKVQGEDSVSLTWIEFEADTSKLTLMPGGVLDVEENGGLYISDENPTYEVGYTPASSAVRVSVYAVTGGVVNETTAQLVTNEDAGNTAWKLKAGGASGTAVAITDITLGKLKFSTTADTPVSNVDGEAATPGVAGTLEADNGTAVVFLGAE